MYDISNVDLHLEKKYILFAHSKHSEQSMWFHEQVWNPFVRQYTGSVQLLYTESMNSTILCQFDVKAFPVVRLIYNNTFGRVIELQKLNEIVKYKFNKQEMPVNLATFFTEYSSKITKMCTFQVEFHNAIENWVYDLEMRYQSYRDLIPYKSMYVIGHDIPLILFIFYFIGKKVLQVIK